VYGPVSSTCSVSSSPVASSGSSSPAASSVSSSPAASSVYSSLAASSSTGTTASIPVYSSPAASSSTATSASISVYSSPAASSSTRTTAASLSIGTTLTIPSATGTACANSALNLHITDPPYDNYFYSDCHSASQVVVTNPRPGDNLTLIGPRLLVSLVYCFQVDGSNSADGSIGCMASRRQRHSSFLCSSKWREWHARHRVVEFLFFKRTGTCLRTRECQFFDWQSPRRCHRRVSS